MLISTSLSKWRNEMKSSIFARLALAASICLLALSTFNNTYADLWADYSAAVSDAEEEGIPGKISRELTAITRYNNDLLWKNQASGDRLVLMTTWGDEWYSQHYQPGDEFTVDPAHLVWVTAVP